MALRSDNCFAPIARVTDKTVGLKRIKQKIFCFFGLINMTYIAIGNPPISKTNILLIPRR
jgi:hypothetical protein